MVRSGRQRRFVGEALEESKNSITLSWRQVHEGIQHFIFDDEAETHESETCRLQGLVDRHEVFCSEFSPLVHGLHPSLNSGSLSFPTSAIFLRKEISELDAFGQTEVGNFLFEF